MLFFNFVRRCYKFVSTFDKSNTLFEQLFTMKKVLSTPDLTREAKLQAFDRLLTIMDELRENCPWDKKQTLESFRHLTIEETYELSDSILEGNLCEIKKELGDI